MQKQTSVEEAMARKYPESVVLVTTRNAKGRANVMAVGWVMIASSEPVMFALGIDDGAYTHDVIVKQREFVVAFPHEGMGKETLYVGTHHGHREDKLAGTNLALEDACKVKAPLLADAVANFECRLVDIVKPGDCPLVIGKVVCAHVHAGRALRRLYTVAKGHKLGGVRAYKGS